MGLHFDGFWFPLSAAYLAQLQVSSPAFLFQPVAGLQPGNLRRLSASAPLTTLGKIFVLHREVQSIYGAAGDLTCGLFLPQRNVGLVATSLS